MKPKFLLLIVLSAIIFTGLIGGIVSATNVSITANYSDGDVITTPVSKFVSGFLSFFGIDNNVPKPTGENLNNFTAQTYNQTWLNFDGSTSNKITTSSQVSSVSFLKNFTICGWFNATGTLSTETIFASSVNTNDRLAIQYSGSGQHLRAGIYNGTVYVNLASINETINKTNIVGFCYTCIENGSNGGFCNMTANRKLGISSVGNPSADSTATSVIGCRTGGSSCFNGSIYNLYIFNKSMVYLETNAIQLNYYNNYENEVNVISQSTIIGAMYVNSTGALFGNAGTKMKVSLDNGTTFTDVYTFTEGTGTSGVFVDSRGTIFAGRDGTAKLYYSMGNDTNWTYATPFACNGTLTGGANGTFFNMGMSEDSLGHLYLAEYASGYENCSYIHKSTDGGHTWSIVYNSTAYGKPARHMHMVQVDPYTDYIYASQGDSYTNASLIRSTNHGLTWTTLQEETAEGWSDGVDAQYTSIAFTENCRFFGTDSAKPNKIIKTCDDSTFSDSLVLNGTEGAYIWVMRKDNNGVIYASTISHTSGDYGGMYVSDDNGLTWNKILDVGKTSAVQKGIKYFSNFDLWNYAYIHDNQNNRNFRIIPNNSKVLYYKLNENTGTTAYDSSGNGNNGTISGATWQNDGVLVSLRDGVDYVINKTTGLFTLLNNLFSFSWININSESSTTLCPIGSTNYTTSSNNTNISVVSCNKNNMYSLIITNNGSTAQNITANLSLTNGSVFYPYNNFTNYETGEIIPVSTSGIAQLGVLDSYEVLYLTSGVPPTITSIQPANLTTNTTSPINFSANLTDDVGLTNSTLYVMNTSDNNLITNFVEYVSGEVSVIFSALIDLADGIYKWWISLWDDEGKETISGNYSLTIDTTYPRINLTYPLNTTYPYRINYTNYTIIETNPSYCWLSNGTTNSSLVSPGTNFTTQSIEGLNTWIIFCNDTGNLTNSSRISFTQDTTPPVITITNPTILKDENANPVHLTASTNEQATCNYSLDGGTNTSLGTGTSFSEYFTLANGLHTIRVFCNDSFGNQNNSGAVISFNVYITSGGGGGGSSGDTTSPTINETQTTENETIETTTGTETEQPKESGLFGLEIEAVVLIIVISFILFIILLIFIIQATVRK